MTEMDIDDAMDEGIGMMALVEFHDVRGLV